MGPGGSGGKGEGGKGGGKGGNSLSPMDPADPLPPLDGGLPWGAFGGPEMGEDFGGNGAILMARSAKENSRHIHDCPDDYVIECDDDCLYRYTNLRITHLFMPTLVYSKYS